MRILVVGPGLDVQGGVSHVIRLMLEYPPPDAHMELVPTLTQQHAVSHLSRTSPAYWQGAWRNWQFFVRALSEIERRAREVDLAHIHVSVAGSTLRKMLVAKRLARRNTPFLLHNHGADYHLFYARLPHPLKQQVIQMFLSALGTIVLSEWWSDFHRRLLQCPSYPLWVMPNPIEIPVEAHSTVVDNSPLLKLLYLGRMDERKGSARVLRALAALPSEIRRQVQLRMAGDGEVSAMRQLACELGLETLVEIRDWIGGEDKRRWLRETNAFILPSRAEGLPMSLLEAMAWGKALIVSPVGGIPEFVDEGQEGFLVPPDDIEAISSAIRCLAESPGLRARMGQAARARVEPLDIQRYRLRLGEVYREALEQTPTSR